MATSYLDELSLELRNGTSEKDHPFRYATMGTVGLDRIARLRTLVLRHVGEDYTLSFYTDKRSKKVLHIKENKNVSLLFYHPGKMLQLKIEGVAVVIKDPDILKPLWEGMAESSKKDYTTVQAPGSAMDTPQQLEYLREENFFCLVEVHPFKIEYLKLKKPDHLRIRYSRETSGWKQVFLVP